jgi:hypothetical protein
MSTNSGFWQGNRKQVPVLAVMGALITLNLGPTASNGIRVVEAALILWCAGFAAWFWRHPAPALAAADAGVSIEEIQPATAEPSAAVAVVQAAPPAHRPVDADPLSQACRRFGLPIERAADEVTRQQ